MIKLDLSVAVALYVSIFVIGILIIWVFSKDRYFFKKYKSDKKFVWQCPICLHVYIDSKNAVISECPRCFSLNKRKLEDKDIKVSNSEG